jgi:butyryl-CoA dehydrogenase
MDFQCTEEQRMIQDMVRNFTQKEVEPRAKEIDATDKFPHDLVRRIREMNLLGLPYPEKYGGSGSGYMAYVLAVEQIAQSSCCVAGCLSVQANSEEAIFRYGTEDQKQEYLVPLARGEKLGCFAFSEPATGSDPKSLKTRAKLIGDEYVLNGEKRFITPAPVADIAVIFAKTEDERASAFVVETDCPGFTTGSPYDKMGDRGSDTADIYLDDVKVPKENLLGRQGQGYQILLEAITAGKMGWCARGLGMAQRALDESIKYAKERIVHGRPMAELLSIQGLIAEIAMRVETIRWLTYRVSWLRDQGQSIIGEVALVKLLSAGASVEAIRQAIQVHGSYGYIKEFKVEQLYRDAKLNEVIEGSQELQRVIVARTLLQ